MRAPRCSWPARASRLPRVPAVAVAVAVSLLAAPLLAQTRTVRGTVRDSVTGEPVTAGAVLVRGTAIGASLRVDGTFLLAGAPTGDLTLLVRSLGYRRRDIPVSAAQSELDIRLARDVFKIEQVVVTGAATTIERRSAPNAVAVVNAADLAVAPTVSVEQQLMGKVAGADIQQNAGNPGGGMQVRLRGVTSVNADAQPLYVVDGIIMSDVAVPSNQNAVTAASGGSSQSLTQDNQVNRIADLNPADIETIEVLKGASAAAIYGGRASNGVVLITTRRGRAGAPQVDLRQDVGFSQQLKYLGTRRFRSVAEVDAQFGPGTAARVGFAPGVFFDNERELSQGNHPARLTQASVAGGSEASRYYGAAIIEDEDGVMMRTGYQRQSARLNLDQQLGDRVQTSLSASVTHSLARRGLTGNDNAGASIGINLAFTPSIIDLRRRPDGTFPRNPFTAGNPLQTAALMQNDEDVHRYTIGGRLSWAPWQSARQTLAFNGVAGADYFAQRNTLYFPPELQFEPSDGLPGTALLSTSPNLNLNFDANAVHTLALRGATATTTVGLQRMARDLTIGRIESRNLVGGQSNVDAGTNVVVRETRQHVNDFGFFGQEQLQMLRDRLTVTLGLRGDQSSLDADASKLYYFPKAAASYRFERVGPFGDLKLRAAYGTSGNQPLYAQRFTPLLANRNINGNAGLVVQGTTGARNLGPERQAEIEGGIDASLWRGRASLEATVYQKRITDLLLTRNLPTSSGFTTEIFNGGELRTRGIELALGLAPLQSRTLNWVSRTTFAANRATITELPVPPFYTGGFDVTLGTFRIEKGRSPTQLVGNDTIGGKVVARRLGDANPDFRMGFSNQLTWGPVGVTALVEWQRGSTIVNLTRTLYDFGGVTKDYADPIPGSTQTRGERRIAGFGTVTANYLEDGSYVKLREVSLFYEVPRSALRRLPIGARSVRLTASARNALMFTDYTGYDPEVSNFGNQPIGRNIDITPYPPSRTFYLGLAVGF